MFCKLFLKMISSNRLLLLFFFVSQIIWAQNQIQQSRWVDELGSPIKEVHLVSAKGTRHVFSNKEGFSDLSSFETLDLIIVSHPGFVSLSLTKEQILKAPSPIVLDFNSKTIGEVILRTRINDENIKTTADRRLVIHSKEIERLNTQTTADLLEKRAGINVQKSQMGGGSPVIRGFEANRVLLMVDGVRLNNAIYRGGHLQSIISIDNATLDKVDIVFGPSSSEYGSDALGGLIHLQTKRPRFSEDNQFLHNYYSRYATANKGTSRHYDFTYTGKNFALFSSFSQNNFGDLRMGANRSHGFQDWGKVFHFIEEGVQVGNDNVNIQRNTAYQQTDMMQKVILELDDNWILTGNFQLSNSTDVPRFDRLNDYNDISYNPDLDEVDHGTLKYSNWAYGPQKRTLSSFQLDHSLENPLMDSAQIIFAYQDVYESRHVENLGDSERYDRYENVDIYSINLNLRKKKIHYGLEYFYNNVASSAYYTNEDRTSPSVQTRYPNGGSAMSSLAAYLSYRKKFNERFTINTGLRQTSNHLKAVFYSIPGQWDLPFDKISYAYKALTGNLSLAFHPNDSWKIAGIISTGFHAPNIDDTGKLFYKSDVLTIPNFNLQPEHTKTTELNITKNIDNTVLFNTNIYYTHIDDVIMKVNTDQEWQINPEQSFTDIRTNENVGNAEIYGVTFSLSARVASNYTIESDYTLIKGRNIDTNLPFTHIPPSFGKTAFYADFEDWRASFFVLYNGKKSIDEYDIASGTDNEEESPIEWVMTEEGNYIIEYKGTPSWFTLNMSAMHRISKSLTVQVALENVLDQHYKTFASGLSGPGRNFILTLRANF